MKFYKIKPVEIKTLEKITCSICDKDITEDSCYDRIINISHKFGYGSNIGDGLKLEMQICEDCFCKMLDNINRNIDEFLYKTEE